MIVGVSLPRIRGLCHQNLEAMAARSGRKHGPRGIKRAHLSTAVPAELVEAVDAAAAAQGWSRARMASVLMELGLRTWGAGTENGAQGELMAL